MAASLMAQVSSVACRPPPGTSGPPPRATRRPLSPRPRSTDPPQSPPRTAAGSPAAPRLVGQATPATRLVAPDPSAVSQPSSQPPPSRCCDDNLNPPVGPKDVPAHIPFIPKPWRAQDIAEAVSPAPLNQPGRPQSRAS